MYLCCSILRRTQSPANFLDSDYEIYMVCLPVATVNWHKSPQFVKRFNITLLIYDFYLPFRLLYYAWVLLFDRSPGFALRFPLPHLYHKLVMQSFDTNTSEYLPYVKIFVYVELKKLKYVLPSLIVVSAAAKQLKAGCCFNTTEIFSTQTGEQSAMLWE